MDGMKKSPPWETFYNEVKSLFDGDADVKVTKEYADDHKCIVLYVHGEDKADALTRLLPQCRLFGNVGVDIVVKPANDVQGIADLFEKAFDGNPNVNAITSAALPGGGSVSYVVMADKIVQFYDDDLTSYCGAKTMLMEDAAKDVFGEINWVYFCTQKI